MAEPAYRGSWLPLTAESICNGMTKEAGFVARSRLPLVRGSHLPRQFPTQASMQNVDDGMLLAIAVNPFKISCSLAAREARYPVEHGRVSVEESLCKPRRSRRFHSDSCNVPKGDISTGEKPIYLHGTFGCRYDKGA